MTLLKGDTNDVELGQGMGSIVFVTIDEEERIQARGMGRRNTGDRDTKPNALIIFKTNRNNSQSKD